MARSYRRASGAGAADLVAAARQLIEAGLDLPRAAEALEAALEVYDRTDASEYLRVEVAGDLVTQSIFTGPALAERFGDRVTQMLLELSGLDRAAQAARWLGPKLGLAVGLGSAEARRRRLARRGEHTTPVRTLVTLLVRIAAVRMSVASTTMHHAACQRIFEQVQPLSLFGPDHICRLFFDHCAAMRARMHGCDAEAAALARSVLERLERPEAFPELAGHHRRHLHAGVLYLNASLAVFTGGDEARTFAEKLHTIDSPLAHAWTDQLWLYFHALRGETRLAERYRARVERRAVSGGSTWQAEVHLPVILMVAARATDDRLLSMRACEEIEQLCARFPQLEIYRKLGHIQLRSLRGQLTEVVAELVPLLDSYPPRSMPGWSVIRGSLAKVLNRMGRHAEAQALCQAALAELAQADLEYAMVHVPLRLELALAQAGAGLPEEAWATLDATFKQYAGRSSPTLRGMLHRCGAQLALVCKDAARFREHLKAVGLAYAETDNPSLIQHTAALARQAIECGLDGIAGSPQYANAFEAPIGDLEGPLAAYDGAPIQPEAALALILHLSQAREAHLYLLQEQTLVLAASVGGNPPPAIEAELRSRIASLDADDPDTLLMEHETDSDLSERADATVSSTWRHAGVTYLLANLFATREGVPVPVGAVALRGSPDTRLPPARVLMTLAEGLLAAEACAANSVAGSAHTTRAMLE
jgi:tetratricopeptide (TPR) repeat protein